MLCPHWFEEMHHLQKQNAILHERIKELEQDRDKWVNLIMQGEAVRESLKLQMILK